ncbi:MAG: type II toxin-antitoxin system HicB family antitoxin [Terracidiphilus sp.]|jgi:predicted RNase H-like HicB family nuclease
MTAILSREDDGFVALCPDLDIASQGSTIEEARANLVEALTLFFETASSSEIARRLPAGRIHSFAYSSPNNLKYTVDN